MNTATRFIAVGALLALGVWAIFIVNEDVSVAPPVGKRWGTPPQVKGDKPLLLKSSKQCAECHPAIYNEWKSSHHEFAWLNPEPRRKELSNNFRNKDCIPCHAPRPLLEVGFGERPLERETRREDGVNCFTCHRSGQVVIAANDLGPGAANAPCNPVTWKAIAEVKLCSPCHDQHKVEQDWQRSRYAVKGSAEYKDCNDCHMPVTGGPGTVGGARRTHRGHGFKGGHDEAILRSAGIVRAIRLDNALTLAAAVEKLTGRDWRPAKELNLERGVLIEVKNTGTGHNLPSDERHRAVDLYVRFKPSIGKATEEVRLTRFRNPYRDEYENRNPFKDKPDIVLTNQMSWAESEIPVSQVRLLPDFNPNRKVYYPESTQLHAGESRLLWFEVPDWGRGTLELRLFYKLQPFLSNEDAVQIAETRVAF